MPCKITWKTSFYFLGLSKNQWAQLLTYTSPYSILVVRWDNVLIEVFCPFKVLVKHDVEELNKGQQVWVKKGLVSNTNRTVYDIGGTYFYYDHFEMNL